jgi:spermidine synthase
LGIHHVVEFVNCKSEHLNDPIKLEKFVLEGIKKSGLKSRSIISHKFEPVGVTVLAIISESHIAIHTYPEAESISLDVFTCSDPKKQEKFIEFMKKKLKPEIVEIVEIQRGNTIDIIDKNWIISEADIDFEIKYHIKKRLYQGKSEYQWIDVIENESFGRMLFLDRDLQIAEYDAHIYNAAILEPIKKEPERFKNVAIFGGGDGGILKDLLKLNPEKVTLIDIDKEVIEISKKYLKKICGKAFDDPRAEIVNEDVNRYMNKMKAVDAIVSDLTMHPETFTHLDRPTYLKRLFGKIKRKLRKNGVLTMQVCSAFDKETYELVNSLLTELFKEVEYRKVYIPSFAEEWIFATAKK